MSQAKLVPLTISYDTTTDHGDCVYVAGTFTRPEWLLQEMPRGPAKNGSICYSKKIMAEPNKEHQYRLKLWREGDWIVDENKPIVTSVLGTKSNILRVPQEEPSEGNRRKSSRNVRGGSADADIPLFDHERIGSGSYDAPDDNPAPALCDMTQRSPQPYDCAGLDLRDPRIEDFPCNKDDIMGTLRKIQSSHSDSGVVIEDGPGHGDGRRSSLDSDEGSTLSALSSGQLSPTSIRRRENRLSTGSAGRNKSVSSLGAIAEEPGARRAAGEKPAPKRKDSLAEDQAGGDGEGLMMRGSRR